MKLNRATVKRHWSSLRIGHSTYLAFMLSVTNFILIGYTFFVSRVLPLEIWQFAIIFIGCYIPLAIFVGRWHRRSQLATEQKLIMDHSPISAKYHLLGMEGELLHLAVLSHLLSDMQDEKAIQLKAQIDARIQRVLDESVYFRDIMEKNHY